MNLFKLKKHSKSILYSIAVSLVLLNLTCAFIIFNELCLKEVTFILF